MITIVLDDRDDAQQIFQSLNATGKPLTEGEKVKNWLLMGLSEDVQTELHGEHWLAMERALGARHDAERIDVFLRDMMRWRTGKLVAGSETYDEFRRVGDSRGPRQPGTPSRTMCRGRDPGLPLRTAHRHRRPSALKRSQAPTRPSAGDGG